MLAFFSLHNLCSEHLPAFIARMRMLTSKLFTCPAKTGIHQSHVRVSFPAFCLRSLKRGKAVSGSHLLQIRTTWSPSDPKSSGGARVPTLGKVMESFPRRAGSSSGPSSQRMEAWEQRRPSSKLLDSIWISDTVLCSFTWMRQE